LVNTASGLVKSHVGITTGKESS